VDHDHIDTLVTQLRGGQLDRRQFLSRVAALGIPAGVATSLMHPVHAQEASPAGSPSPMASPQVRVTSGHALTSMTRDESWQAIRQAFPLESPGRQGGSIITGATSDISTLNPILAGDALSGLITGFLFDWLVTIGPVDGLPAPGLADFWERSDDGLVYTFHLNPKATWHDGRPVTAADVVFSFQAALAEGNLSQITSTVADVLAEVRAVDDHTVELVAKDLFATFVESTAALVAIVPKHIWQSVPPANWGNDSGSTGQDPRRVIGSGPFTFREWVPEDHVTIVKRLEHWDHNAQPVIDEFTVRVFPDASARIQAFETAEIDFVGVEPTFAEALRQSRPDAVFAAYDTTNFSYYIPMQDPDQTELFVDIPVRQALMFALDRQAIADSIYLGYAIPANGTQPVLSVAYRPEQITTVYTYDPERARQLLDGAGWTVGDAGIRQRNGVRFSFACLHAQGVAFFEQLLPYMQQAWRDVGLEMIPRAVPFPTLLDALDAGDFEMALLGFGWGVDGGQGIMYRCNAVPPAGYNTMRYCNPHYDALDDAQARELDEARRVALLVEASNLINDEAANGVYTFQKAIAGAQPRLHNFLPNGYSDTWWLPFAWVDGS